jgi:hypothetical protein
MDVRRFLVGGVSVALTIVDGSESGPNSWTESFSENQIRFFTLVRFGFEVEP